MDQRHARCRYSANQVHWLQPDDEQFKFKEAAGPKIQVQGESKHHEPITVAYIKIAHIKIPYQMKPEVALRNW